MTKKYTDYLKSIKVGDTVYPCYDGKGGRATKCVVIEITGEYITVEGPLHGYYIFDPETKLEISPVLITKFDRTTGECWTNYGNEDEPTLMDYIKEAVGSNDEDEELSGDLYILQDIPSYVKEGFFGWRYDDYLSRLGIERE